MDGQKFGNDIPETGREIVQSVKKAGFDGIIEVWIEISSGKAFCIEWESMDPFKTIEPVAPSFFDFVSNIAYRQLSSM